MVTLLRNLVIAVCLLDIIGHSAHAYLDPGIGSQAMQVGLAGLLGLAFTLRGSLTRLFSTLRRRK
jgi:hypothetical protein